MRFLDLRSGKTFMKKWAKIVICVLVLAMLIPLFAYDNKILPAILELAETAGIIPTEHIHSPQEFFEPEMYWELFPEDLELTARQAFVYDCQTETFTYLMGRPDDIVYPASITKLFTAYVVLQHLDPEQTIQADEVLELVSADSSVAGVQTGNVLTVEMLVEGMLLPSGNDAAYILAAEVGRTIVDDPDLESYVAITRFVDEMNRQARMLGMTGTNFSNPDGYHFTTHYTTYEDMALIGKLALENETIRKYANVAKENVIFASGEKQTWENTNALLNPESEYYCQYAIGLKTGYTSAAGSCLLSAFQYEGRQWIIGVFGCPEHKDRFADTLLIFNSLIQ